MKPILFNTEMVRAILDGRKSTTRRVIKPQPESCTNVANGILAGVKADAPMYPNYGGRLIKPPYQVGDILYVRETGWKGFDGDWHYAADYLLGTKQLCKEIKAIPSIFMPKEAARIFLRVVDVKAERLQDITEDEAKAEGCGIALPTGGWEKNPLNQFVDVWNTTVKKSDRDKLGWAANPWVWVYTFERCEKPGDGS